MPKQSTIYDFGEVAHESAERLNPDSTWDRIEIRLKQYLQLGKDTIDLSFDTYHARLLAYRILDLLGEHVAADSQKSEDTKDHPDD